MRNRKLVLTDRLARSAKPAGKEYNLHDATLQGFAYRRRARRYRQQMQSSIKYHSSLKVPPVAPGVVSSTGVAQMRPDDLADFGAEI